VTRPALYLDENFGLTFGKVLASRGLDVVTAQAADRLGRSDREQLVFAARHGRCLVTQNIAHFVAIVYDVMIHANHRLRWADKSSRLPGDESGCLNSPF